MSHKKQLEGISRSWFEHENAIFKEIVHFSAGGVAAVIVVGWGRGQWGYVVWWWVAIVGTKV